MESLCTIIRGIFHKRVSTDELKVFNLIANRLPAAVAQTLLFQVDAILTSKISDDGRSLVYRIDEKKIRQHRFTMFEVGNGPQAFVDIVICLNEVRQPFTLYVLDGLLHTMRMRNPHRLMTAMDEFSVISFNYYNKSAVGSD